MVKVKKGTDSKTDLQINQIIIKPLNRQKHDVNSWRSALKSADNGKRTALYDMYEDILLDNVLSDAIDKRVRAISNADLIFSVDDKPVDEIDQLMETTEWEEMLIEIMMAKFWGVTVLEFDFRDYFAAHSIPRNNIKPEKGIITINQNDQTGVNYKEDDFFLEIKPKKSRGRESFGLILKACPYVIYKRGGFGDWAQFTELFGMPFRIGKYNAYDEATRIQLTQALEQAGSAAYVVIPKEGDVEYRDNNSKGDGALYNNLRKACNEEILLGILGQTMTSLQGDKGARSLGEVHMEVQETIHASDRKFISRILNNEILPRLEARGFPVAGGKFNFPEMGENLTLKERMDIDVQLDKIVQIEPEYFYETYGLPKPKDGGGRRQDAEPVKKEDQNPKKPDENKDEDKDKKTKLMQLWDFFLRAPAKIGASTGDHLTQLNDLNIDLDEFDEDALIKRVATGNAELWDAKLYEWTASMFLKAFASGWAQKSANLSDFGIDYGLSNEVAQTLMELNLFHFSAGKTLAEITELNKLFRSATSFKEFQTEARKLTNVFNSQWMQTEYNTAYLTAESSATYYRLLSQAHIFPYWIYSTQRDEKVRESHGKLDGLILPYNDKRWSKIMPPNDWNCRCYILPRAKNEVDGIDLGAQRDLIDQYINSAEFKKAAAQGWGVNRAELKQVFLRDQHYIRKFPGKAAKALNKLNFKDFGLSSAKKLQQSTTDLIPKFKGIAEDWITEKVNNNIILTDYNGRRIMINEANFKRHTTGSRMDRVQYLDAMKETILNPGEIWARGELLDEFVYIKYYQDEILIVVSQVKDGKLNEIKTWFSLRMKKELIDDWRSGLLIKKQPD